MSHVREALRRISEGGLGDFCGAVPEDQIREAEETLGVTFPDDYREFLSVLGCGDIHGSEFYGIIPGRVRADGVPSVVWRTLRLRESDSLPQHLVPIHDLGEGSIYCVDATDPGGSLKVWYLGSDHGPLGKSLGEFLLEVVEDEW